MNELGATCGKHINMQDVMWLLIYRMQWTRHYVITQVTKASHLLIQTSESLNLIKPALAHKRCYHKWC